MELVVKGRHTRVAPATRERIERKLARLARTSPRVQRVEVELIAEPARVDGGRRIEAACHTPRRTFRATATGRDVDAALDRLVERLERQLADERGRRRARLIEGAYRVKSAGTSAGPEGSGPPPA